MHTHEPPTRSPLPSSDFHKEDLWNKKVILQTSANSLNAAHEPTFTPQQLLSKQLNAELFFFQLVVYHLQPQGLPHTH